MYQMGKDDYMSEYQRKLTIKKITQEATKNRAKKTKNRKRL